MNGLNVDWRSLLSTAGMTVAALSGYAAISLGVELWSGGDGETTTGVYVGLIVFFLGTALAGVYLARRLGRPPAGRPAPARAATRVPAPAAPSAPVAPPEADPEQAVLALARRERGRLTVLEVAARCGLTADEAKALLDRLVTGGTAELHVTDDGVLVYVFPALVPTRSGRRRRRRDRQE